MFITQKQLPYLAQVTNYLMERPTVDRKLLGERLAQTLTIVTECPKISKRPEIISALLPGLLSIDPRNLALRFKELLQTVVNICLNNLVKYPELGEFLERIKLYNEELKNMKREIIIPNNSNDWVRDVDLENKLLGLVTENKWNDVADLFLKIPLQNYCEMSKFTLKLFEVVTEEHRKDGSSLADDAFIQF